jgi:hypothetical protein
VSKTRSVVDAKTNAGLLVASFRCGGSRLRANYQLRRTELICIVE